jgi:uncharacterized phage-associated protein
MVIRFRFAPDKALEAIKWMLVRHSPVDLHTALKTCYFADKSHLNKFYQPIFGATYQAMAYGPVPLEVYELIKGESLRLSELKIDDVPWRLSGYNIHYTDKIKESNLDRFTESELVHLQEAFDKSRGMNFTQRTAVTHGPDWQRANGGVMRYEDMLEESAHKSLVIKELAATSRYMIL